MMGYIFKLWIAVGVLILMASAAFAKEYHVSANGNDANKGSKNEPFKSIQAATDAAQPGDVITVHEGVYRERVNPPRGGVSEKKRITYRAAKGEKVVIKGSEVVKGWEKVQGYTWKVVIPNIFFGDFNPFNDLIRGDWFARCERDHHTGAVYLNGHWLTEAAKLEEVQKPIDKTPLWFAEVDDKNTTVWAQFKEVNPNEAEVEVNVRRTVFYPDKPGRNFITVRGFTMMHAATPWAPPTAEQIGLIGTHWSKGWIIEDNDIRYSVCTGVTLGKYGDEFDNTSQDTAEGYVKTIERALENGWSKENIGHHIVRNNTISHCEQAGLVGSLGAIFSTISGNTIHDIHVRRLFGGAEMAGIKFTPRSIR
jgi:alpha-L-arabinofuranosidase